MPIYGEMPPLKPPLPPVKINRQQSPTPYQPPFEQQPRQLPGQASLKPYQQARVRVPVSQDSPHGRRVPVSQDSPHGRRVPVPLDPQLTRQLPQPSPTPYQQSRDQAQEQKQKVKSGLTNFFGPRAFELISESINKTLVPALLGAALFPFFGPVGSIATALGVVAVVHSIHEQLESSDLHLGENTLNKLVEPLRGKQLNEEELRTAILKVLPDRQANEDLKQFFLDLVPILRDVTAQKDVAAKTTHIEISGPVQGLIVNPERSKITQTFESFLHDSAKG
jgi:hypothetical protein